MRIGGALHLLSTVLLAACASTPEPKEPFRPFQFGRDEAHAPAPRPVRQTKVAAAPVRLDAALLGFAARQRDARANVRRGEPMPEWVRQGWTELLGEIDRFLRQRPEDSIPLDIVRGRVAIDAELDLDAAHYAALPGGLLVSVRARTLALSQRLAEVRRLAQPARRPPTQLVW
ncbi:MAG: hypothetical protein ACK4N5_09400, partial [Myxococcales bacterium]